MIDKELLDILVCPDDRSPLDPADEGLIEKLNRAIEDAKTEIFNQGGDLIEEPLAGGLVRQDKTLLYPILDGIPVLLEGASVALNQLD